MTPSEFYALMQSRADADKIAEKQKQGRGRPLKYNESTVQISFRLPKSLADRLGENRHGKSRQIVIDHIITKTIPPK